MLLFPPLYVCLLLLLGLKHISFRVMLPTHYWIKCVTHNSVFCASHLLHIVWERENVKTIIKTAQPQDTIFM